MVWWQKYFKKEEVKIDKLADIRAVQEFLREVNLDIHALKPLIVELEELEKERKVAQEGLLLINLQTQADLLDKIMERYEFFQNDVDINATRIRKAAGKVLEEARQVGLTDLAKTQGKKRLWRF